MNLYWVDNAIYKLYDEFVDPETGEITDAEAFAEKYAALQLTREEVIENTLLMYKNATADAAAIAEEIKNLTARKAATEKRAERFKADAAAALNGEKFASAKVTATWRKSPAKAEADDEALTPDEFIKITKTPMKTEIKAALKQGIAVPGWHLAEGAMSMTVK